MDNRNFAKGVIEKFNESGLLGCREKNIKRACYPEEDVILREWLERRRISFVHEDELKRCVFGRDMLECMLAGFDSVQDVYFMLKEAL